MTRTDLRHQLAVLLGGRTAEEIALGEISTGAQNDLQRASDIARAMVTEWGMSDAIGAINYAGEKRSRFLELGLAAGARRLCREHGAADRRRSEAHHDRGARDGAAHPERPPRQPRIGDPPLLEKEVMEGDELRRLLGMPQVAGRVADPFPCNFVIGSPFNPARALFRSGTRRRDVPLYASGGTALTLNRLAGQLDRHTPCGHGQCPQAWRGSDAGSMGSHRRAGVRARRRRPQFRHESRNTDGTRGGPRSRGLSDLRTRRQPVGARRGLRVRRRPIRLRLRAVGRAGIRAAAVRRERTVRLCGQRRGGRHRAPIALPTASRAPSATAL